MTRHVDNWFKSAQRLLLPAHCLLCHDATSGDAGLCPACHDDLPWLDRGCAHCALPLPEASASDVCPACRTKPRFDAAIAACHYDTTVRWLITGLKFRARLAHADVLAGLIGERLSHAELAPAELLVPVPLHTTSFRRRGFNQAERIASRLGRAIAVPVVRDAAERIRATAPQSGLSAAERARNVRGAFVCHSDLAGRHVAIVDDVLTTTRTASALAVALRARGAARVDCYAVARA